VERCRQTLALLSTLSLLSIPTPTPAVEDLRTAAVPILSVRHDAQQGLVHYVIIQIAAGSRTDGPVVQFNEIHLGGGSLVGDAWKNGIREAVDAALRQLGIDGHEWLVTVKNRSYSALTDGTSASGAVAVAVMAAWRGDRVQPDVIMTGQVDRDGIIHPVGSVPAKLEAAAREHFRTLLVPKGQLQTAQWDLAPLAAKWAVTVVEVGTLEEAYRAMTQDSR
jgi:hypothetical protein